MSGIFSCVQPILVLRLVPNWVFTMWYPRPFFYFTHKSSWVWWPWSTWHEVYSAMWQKEKQAQRFKREVLCQQTLLTMDTPQREEMSWAIVELCCMRSRNLPRLSADWVYLMRTRRSESQVPFSARCLSARPSCFLAADAGFSWRRARAHSELQQLWDYSGFIDLSKEPQTCWARVKPGPHIQEATKVAAVITVQMAFTHCWCAWWNCCPTSSKMQKVT